MASPSASPTLNQRDGTVVDDASGLVSVIQEASSGETAEDDVYCCRMCRRTIFTQGEVETHEVARQSFHRRKVRVTTTGLSGSLAPPLSCLYCTVQHFPKQHRYDRTEYTPYKGDGLTRMLVENNTPVGRAFEVHVKTEDVKMTRLQRW